MRFPPPKTMRAVSLCLLGTGSLVLVLSTAGCGACPETQAASAAPHAAIPAEQQAGQQAALRAAQQGAAIQAARQAHPNGH